ncbi:hypothetical protein ABZV34_02075 [Streptomyces sp. NPDC005195]|uniref:hypothetical protein n=1 Tax=Streptomyces sp. NPDC005195 TaxID=3154561 RepID=UPI0033A815AC
MSTAPAHDPVRAPGVAAGLGPRAARHTCLDAEPGPDEPRVARPAPRPAHPDPAHGPLHSRVTLASRRERRPRAQSLRRAHLSRGADTAGLPSDPRHHPEGERQMITSRTGESAPGAGR